MAKWKRVGLVVFALGLAACGGGGSGGGNVTPPSSEVPVVLGQPGPGDPGNYFPFSVGNVWQFKGTIAENGLTPQTFTNTVTISGLRLTGGINTTVLLESNPGNSAISEETLLVKDPNGIVDFGNSDPNDVITPQLSPAWAFRLPLQTGASFASLDRKGIDFGDDLDGDGVNEIGEVRSVVSVVGFEAVSLTLGTFADCARVERSTTLTFRLSRDKSEVVVTDVATAWFAPNLGWVKRVDVTSTPAIGFSETVTEELTGYLVDGIGKGVLPAFPIAQNVTTAGSDLSRPGKSAIGFDGTNYLLISCRDIQNSNGLFGMTISPNGQILKEFEITSDGCSPQPAVAFDGVNYLVTFDRGGQIFGTRVSPAGVLLDGATGIQISTSAPGASTNFTSAVAFDGTNYLVAWGKFANGNYDIYGSRVAPTGSVLDEFPVFSAPGEQIFPALSFDGTNFLVTWQDTRSGSGPSLDSDIFGTRVTPTGTVLDPGGIAIATAGGFQGEPQIAFDGTNYFIVWSDLKTLGISPPIDGRIQGRRVAPDGTLVDGAAVSDGIAITTVSSSHSPTLAFDGTNFIVSWAVGGFSNSPPAGIFAARMATDGTLLDGPPAETGLSISGVPPTFSRFVEPVVLAGGANALLSWVNNSELSGTTKSIQGALIYPF